MPRSVSAWFYSENGFGNILSYGDGSQPNRRFSFLMNGGDVKFVGESNDHFGHTVSLNQWHFITVTYVNNKLKMYIDGAIADSVLLGTNLNTDNSYPLVIGSNTTNRNDEYFGGKVTQVSVWDRALTATDVQNHMNCPPSTNALGLLGYWELGNNANDATAYGNNGVIEGAIMSTEGPVFTCSNQSFCTATDDIVVTVNPQEDATFAYSVSSYCSDDTDPIPTISGTAGGVFSSTAGLSINSSTGQVDLDASTPGTYTITYSTPGANCSATSTQDVTITTSSTDFNYGGATEFCLGTTNPVATITGAAGGTFSATGGLMVDATTGAIDLSTATAGNYEITYSPSSNWQQMSNDIDGEAAGDESGSSVSMNAAGDRLAIGAHNNGNGAILVM